MAAIKKYNGSTFVDAAIRKYSTASEIIVPPTTIYCDGSNITTYTLKGNTVQNGTPTPSDPVPVVGVGELETTGEHSGEYKIPILSNGVAYPIYLSEPIRKLTWEAGSAEFVDYVSSTNEHRDINALEFDGSEGWVLQSTNSHGIANFQVTISSANEVYNQNATSVCAYLPQQKQQLIADTTTEGFMWAGYNNLFVRRYASETGTLQAFKDWLAGLKTSGNPFKIIYPLRTPTTESFTAPTIPTSGTAQSFDVDTTLKPSEVSLTYHGWHDSSVKEYDGSDWQ